MSSASNMTEAMERVRSSYAAASMDQDEAISDADELMYDFLRDMGLNEAMDTYREIRGWSF